MRPLLVGIQLLWLACLCLAAAAGGNLVLLEVIWFLVCLLIDHLDGNTSRVERL